MLKKVPHLELFIVIYNDKTYRTYRKVLNNIYGTWFQMGVRSLSKFSRQSVYICYMKNCYIRTCYKCLSHILYLCLKWKCCPLFIKWYVHVLYNKYLKTFKHYIKNACFWPFDHVYKWICSYIMVPDNS